MTEHNAVRPVIMARVVEDGEGWFIERLRNEVTLVWSRGFHWVASGGGEGYAYSLRAAEQNIRTFQQAQIDSATP